ncbi:endonuclease [Fibrisoma montanum]|uniref:Endonuclease n=1 Tax=Fibrisoma montanum TaxID=2305895 RepID=A0A418M4J9_9BACT|nr:endonuclease/exonuclease/phosphatase family protein [Fibrisoma montanum]RIV20594.1 endonuclease [Fibrisoma montanum]
MRFRVGELIAYFFRSLFWSFNLLLVLYTLLAYWLLYKLPVEHWSAGMIMITLPVVWVFNLIVVFFWLATRPWRSWLSGLVLILGIILFGQRTFQWHQPAGDAAVSTPDHPVIKVFSYNVGMFNLSDYWSRHRSSPPIRRTLNYVLRYDAPIKCFQEFCSSTTLPEYNMVRRLRNAGYEHSVVLYPELLGTDYGDVGVAIFSKYPIIHSGREIFNGRNGLVWANIKVGNDTIRIINVHLHSMGIRVGKVLRQDELTGVKQETRGILSALRFGFMERREQVRKVERHITESEFPVIVTGDHNDTPYSVVYERLRRILRNSFEAAGSGFGFTYNRPPGFIRIDYQFFDPQHFDAVDFETINYVRYSDHYPIAGTYRIK